MIFNRNGLVEIVYRADETPAVYDAILHLKADLYRILGARVALNVVSEDKTQADNEREGLCYGVQNGPCRISEDTGIRLGYDISRIHIETRKEYEGTILPDKQEAYAIFVKDGELYLWGHDRRGTVFAIYDLCQQIGVSPWYFFADVPVREQAMFELAEDYVKIDYPTVSLRGIFINDEEELEKWVQGYMAEPTIGPKTYEHIFELLLRLKLNYIWPAMHVNSFNANPENGRLADKMGIIVGTSHCDMLMRSNNREWEPWKLKKGYTNLEYDFSIEGVNRDKLLEYWRESIEQNKDNEVTYTLGMRGIHDSGFNTKTLAGLEGQELLNAKIELLTDVIKAQQKLLDEVPHEEALKIFVPYKEVLELYDNGLKVPEDYTLIWTNDNYGHVRRYPDEKARERSGGHGIYYHQSYWAAPGTSYLFVNTAPLTKTKNELLKAYKNGINKLWVTNFGAIKPLEMQLSYYANLAWEAGRIVEDESDILHFITNFIEKNFSCENGSKLARLLMEFDQVADLRKPELMDNGVFMQEGEDEACGRIHFLKHVYDTFTEIYNALPRREQDAFFELILFRIHAVYYTNCMYYYADRSIVMANKKDFEASQEAYDHAEDSDLLRRCLINYYNTVMLNGKWNGIITPEDFPPPRTAMFPVGFPGICYEDFASFDSDVYIASPYEKEEISNRITKEVGEASTAPKLIGYAGRGIGELAQFEDSDESLTFSFNVENAGEYNFTIERYPSLNSVGEIGVDVTLNGKKLGRLIAAANDEHRGSWRQNVLNQVDLMTISLGYITEGEIIIELTNASRYFAASRVHIYCGNIKNNHFWHNWKENEYLLDSSVPEFVNVTDVFRNMYHDTKPKHRPTLVMPMGPRKNTLANENIYSDDEYPFAEDSIKLLPDEIVQNDYKAEEMSKPAIGVGIGRTKLSFYRSGDGICSYGSKERVGFKSSFEVGEGEYTCYVCLFAKTREAYDFRISIDGEYFADNSELYWTYATENVYVWIPVAKIQLQAGQHELVFEFLKSGLRVEGIIFE